MEFRISDTFTESLARLTGEEQKAVKTTAFDLQINPTSPGMNFHRLAKSRDRGFWSVRVNQDIRLIVHRTDRSLLLCYVAHHDRAYAWAECRKLETHPSTGAAQLVEIRERVQEIVVPAYVPPVPASMRSAAGAARPPLFAHVTDAQLLAFGVPPEWLADVRRATEDTVLGLADHLPAEAAEALLELATGGAPRPAALEAPAGDPFEHPDALRRFRVVTDVEELARALEYPWERWIVFLHPAQRDLVERRFGGPARIAGSAGTGKTVVALHRTAHLARVNPDARILLTTFSEALASALRIKLGRLIGTEPRLRERIDVDPLDVVARRLHDRLVGRAEVASRETVRRLVSEAAGAADPAVSPAFLQSEWTDVVDAWQLGSWESYRDVARLGRKTRLPERQRRTFWTVFERVRASLAERGLVTMADLYGRLAARLADGERSPYDFVVVDESQDVSVAQLRLVASLGRGRPDALFFAGDLGQRIFQVPFSWKSLGVDIRGRSATLRINYRTSHQIRARADRLLGKQITDVDGNVEDRRATVSAFNGPAPVLRVVAGAAEESAVVGRWLAERVAEGVAPGEMAVFVRSAMELPRARAAVAAAGLSTSVLDEGLKTVRDRVAVGTMHLSKGLEFRAVAVMACDDEVLPLQGRIEAVTDQADLEEVYDTERHLLYVACTRARDHLLVTGVAPASEFLRDLGTTR
jgi:superfamily I DNA/RNA helicase/mRNA-degrading endonuclease RelE of RelBE toxin-antitoxin system